MAPTGVTSGAPVKIRPLWGIGRENIDDHDHRWLLALTRWKHHRHAGPDMLPQEEG